MDAKTEGQRAQAQTFSRRQFLMYNTIIQGAPWPLATEAVSTWAMEHPDIDMDEEMTWAEWEAQAG